MNSKECRCLLVRKKDCALRGDDSCLYDNRNSKTPSLVESTNDQVSLHLPVYLPLNRRNQMQARAKTERSPIEWPVERALSPC